VEKNTNEIPMFVRFVEHGLVLLASDFFKGMLRYYDIEYLNLNLNPNGFSTPPSSCSFAKPLWGSSPTRSFSESSSG
jgi:hypothetical protein